MYIMTGTPTIAIVLDIGSGDDDARDKRSAASAVMAPARSEAGRMILCADVLKIPLAI